MKKLYFLLLISIFCCHVNAQSCFTDVSKLVGRSVDENLCNLSSGSDYTADLSLINKENSKKIQLFSIMKEKSGGSVNYTASLGGTNPIYSGDSYSELISSIGGKYKPGRQDVYFDLINFTTTDELNLKSSCEIKLAIIDKDVRVNTINRINASKDLHKEFFFKTSEISDIQTGNIETEIINHKIYYRSLVSYLKESKRYFIEIFSKSMAAIRDFCAIFPRKLLGLSTKPASIADLVSEAKAEMMERNKVSTKDFLIRFKKELSGNMIVWNLNQTNLLIQNGSSS